jgi:hypothetical protein
MKKLKNVIWLICLLILPFLGYTQQQQNGAMPTISYDETKQESSNLPLSENIENAYIEEILEFNRNLDTLLLNLEKDMENLDFQLLRIIEREALEENKRAIANQKPEEIEVVQEDDFLVIDTIVELAESDTLINITPEKSDYQELIEIREEKRDLSYNHKELEFKRNRFRDAIHLQDYKNAEKHRAGIEYMMDEINQGIIEIRSKLENF